MIWVFHMVHRYSYCLPGLPLLHGEVISSLSLGGIRLFLLVLLAGQVALVAA